MKKPYTMTEGDRLAGWIDIDSQIIAIDDADANARAEGLAEGRRESAELQREYDELRELMQQRQTPAEIMVQANTVLMETVRRQAELLDNLMNKLEEAAD